MKKVINLSSAPKAGPYSHAVAAGEFLFVSGQIGIVPETNKLVSDSARDQTVQAMANIGSILKEAGLDYCDIVRAAVMARRIDDFAEINEAYGSFFSGEYPARVFFQCAGLPLNALVEIEVTALHK